MRISVDELEEGMEVVINYYPASRNLLSLRCTISKVYNDTILLDIGTKVERGILKSDISQIILLNRVYDSDLGI